MKNDAKGFTLLEIIVVLAVIGTLAAMVAPQVFRYIEDARTTSAQSDVDTIARSVHRFYVDTGRYPTYANGQGTTLEHTDGSDPYVLSSNTACDGGGALQDDDSTRPAVGTSELAYDKLCDSIANHLIANAPVGTTPNSATAYRTTGMRPWRGPYVSGVPATDPWGASYLVNIRFADPEIAAPNPRFVVAISAGPNNILETDLDRAAASNAGAGGDDIIGRIR